MAQRIWDPYAAFDITSRNSGGMFCVGQAMSKGGSRCRWRIENDNFARVRSILNYMETMPPNGVSQWLPQLAQASLCNEYHQDQALGVQNKWAYKLEAVIEQHQRHEQIQTLHMQNGQLSAQLAAETQERNRLEALLNNQNYDPRLSDRVNELQSQLANTERFCADLSLRANQLQTSLTESQQSNTLLSEQMTESSRILMAERNDFGSYKAGAEARQVEQSQVGDTLRFQLAESYRITARLRIELEEMTINWTTLTTEADELRSHISEECQTSDELRHSLQIAAIDRINLSTEKENIEATLSTERQASEQTQRTLAESERDRSTLRTDMESLRLKLEAECQLSEQTGKTLEETQINEAVLQKEIETLVSQKETKRQQIDHLHRELATSKEQNEALSIQLGSTQDTLSRTQIDLENSVEATEEQKAIASTREANYAVESARTREIIDELERRLSVSFKERLWEKIRRFGRIFARCVTSQRG